MDPAISVGQGGAQSFVLTIFAAHVTRLRDLKEIARFSRPRLFPRNPHHLSLSTLVFRVFSLSCTSLSSLSVETSSPPSGALPVPPHRTHYLQSHRRPHIVTGSTTLTRPPALSLTSTRLAPRGANKFLAKPTWVAYISPTSCIAPGLKLSSTRSMIQEERRASRTWYDLSHQTLETCPYDRSPLLRVSSGLWILARHRTIWTLVSILHSFLHRRLLLLLSTQFRRLRTPPQYTPPMLGFHPRCR
jgi:hypothetical protein